MEILLLNARYAAFNGGAFVKTAFGGDAKGKSDYNAKFIIAPDHPQLADLAAIEEQVAKDKWGAKAAEELKLIRAGNKGLVQDGNTQRSDGFADMKYVSARNETRPSAFNLDRSQITAEDGVLYSGCYVNAKLNIWAQDNAYGKRINAEWTGVQYAGPGDSFAAGAPPAQPDDFPELSAEGAGDEVDPLA